MRRRRKTERQRGGGEECADARQPWERFRGNRLLACACATRRRGIGVFGVVRAAARAGAGGVAGRGRPSPAAGRCSAPVVPPASGFRPGPAGHPRPIADADIGAEGPGRRPVRPRFLSISRFHRRPRASLLTRKIFYHAALARSRSGRVDRPGRQVSIASGRVRLLPPVECPPPLLRRIFKTAEAGLSCGPGPDIRAHPQHACAREPVDASAERESTGYQRTCPLSMMLCAASASLAGSWRVPSRLRSSDEPISKRPPIR